MAPILADNIFKSIFLKWKWQNYNYNLIEICSNESNWQYASISSGNGLAPNRRQDIIWTNADLIHWRIYAALGGDELTMNPDEQHEHHFENDIFLKENVIFWFTFHGSNLFLAVQLTLSEHWFI